MAWADNNTVFQVTWSKKKLWIYTALCAVLALFMAGLPLFLLGSILISGGSHDLDTKLVLIFGFMIAFGLLFVWVPYKFWQMSKRPFAVIDRNGVAGRRRLKSHHINWAKDTAFKYGNKNYLVFNPDPDQSKFSELVKGPKDFVAVWFMLCKEAPKDIEAAIIQLNPYNRKT